MKRKSILNIIIITLLASLLFSCTEIFDKAIVEKSREEATSKIIFDANGGTWESDGASVHTVLGVIGRPLNLANEVDKPERTGYIFKEWISNNDDDAYSDYKNIEKVPEKDLRYTAKWEIDFVEVSFSTKRIPIAEGTTTPITLKANWIPADATDDEIKNAEISWTPTGDEDCFTLTEDASDPSKATVTLKSSAQIGKKIDVTIKLKKTDTLSLEAKCQVIVAEDLEKLGEYKTLSSYSGSVMGGTYVSFGTFPQTVKESSVEILGEKFDEWYECYATKEQGGQTYYLGSDGHWYVKAVSNPYDAKKFSDNTEIKKEDEESGEAIEYYFKVEPIVWRIIDDSKKMLLAEKILTSNIKWESSIAKTRTVYENGTPKEIYASNYKYSNIRAYLNGINHPYVEAGGSGSYANYTGIGFIDIAFTPTQRAKIKETEIKNDKTTMKDNASSSIMVEDGASVNGIVNGVAQKVNLSTLACDDTKDKIFFLSVNEVTNTSYGFTDAYNTSSDARKRTPTDYALVNNLGSENPSWWLRSPVPGKSGGTVPSSNTYKNDERSAWTASNTLGKPYVVTKNIGIVPALCVNP